MAHWGQYITTSAPTLVDMMSDIAALISGESIASLSASCNKTLSTQNGTPVAFCDSIVFDTAEGSSYGGVVSRLSGYWDYEWLRINAIATTAIGFTLAQGWNESTNTATNTTGRIAQTVSTTAANSWWYYIAPNFAYFLLGSSAITILRAETDTPFGAIGGNQTSIMISNNIASSFTPPHRRHPFTGTLVTNTALYWLSTIRPISIGAASTEAGTPTGGGYLPDNTRLHQLKPVYLTAYSAPATILIGSVPGVMYLGSATANLGDIIVDADTYEEYLILFASTSIKFAFKI